MKKLIAILCLLFATITLAQSPQRMNFQSVVRDATNELIQNGEIGIRVSILESSSTGTPIFVERHQPTTNENGLFTIEIGGGTTISGSFNAIDWKSNQYWLKTEYDLIGGSSYTLSSTVQFLSVPYSFHSDYAQNSGNQIANIIDNGNGTLTFEYLNGSSFTTAPLTGLQGQQGESAYQTWLNQGNTGTEQEFIDSLKGNDGQNGSNGQSAYQVWLNQGNTGTEQEFIEGLKGADGIHVTNSFIQNDSLFVQLSSGQTLNAGFLAGVSITNTLIQNDSLFVYFSNGQVINAGSLNNLGQNSNLATVSEPIISNVYGTSADLYATLDETGNELVTHIGFCYSTNQIPTVNDKRVFSFGAIDPNYQVSLGLNHMSQRSLDPSTTYYARSFATNANGTSYSNQVSFTTLPHCVSPGSYSCEVYMEFNSMGIGGTWYENTVPGTLVINQDLTFTISFSDPNTILSCQNLTLNGKILCEQQSKFVYFSMQTGNCQFNFSDPNPTNFQTSPNIIMDMLSGTNLIIDSGTTYHLFQLKITVN